jgi:hypothetical protein
MPSNFSFRKKETEFEKGIRAGAVEKYRNRRPSPQSLCINALDHLEKKFEKVSAEPFIFQTYSRKASGGFLFYTLGIPIFFLKKNALNL